MKKVFVHAGTHKTGSTSLQVFLAKTQVLLAEQGVLYPRSGRPDRKGVVSAGHHELAWSLLGKHGVKTDEAWHQLANELEAWSGGCL
ncbi:hypothetical protein GQ464_004310 [Rhodocaloribacter litoris]|uniref:hypothetical protein n=1 Tax=Rhodocaloribacter litoris TaxID=2558931 RepID=UPI001422F465|nr:hypothetical protein [Rhodocaloribacter litoris]QXD16183.1 hypothetical protein GQ464_004310 [Rhodocaloribacter litoris]